MKKIREWISIQIVKAPGRMVLLVILLANVAFVCVSALIVSRLAPPSLDNGFLSCVYYVLTMTLSGYMEIVVEDIGETGFALVLFAMFNVIVGMIVFTGAVIGYMTDFISGFIESADSGSRGLRISGHIVILNWNTRAAEIINDLLYVNKKEKIVVLAENDRNDVRGAIDERLSVTLEAENNAVSEAASHMSLLARRRYIRKHRIKNKLTIIVREGNTCSAKQLSDIAIMQAASTIILSDVGNEVFVDSHTIKTLIQVAQLTAAEDSADNQQIVVEVEDEQTLALVEKIIRHKVRSGKCNIVPVSVNRILGYIFSQFSIMPELNQVYSTLFSYKDADLFSLADGEAPLSEEEFISEYLNEHTRAIPLTVMPSDGGLNCYYITDSEQDIHSIASMPPNNNFHVSLNPDFEIPERPVIILGSSSKSAAMMEGLAAYNEERKKHNGREALAVTIVGGGEEHYKQYGWVKKVIAAEIHEQDVICEAIDEFIGIHGSGCCILILSDDTACAEDIDENALTYLILAQDILADRLEKDPGFDPGGIDMIVEILDPQNHDIANHYSTKNVVISNRYVSKMIMQISKNKALFDFYRDILTYDDPGAELSGSKELYIKRADAFFSEIPGPCTAAELIRAVYHAAPNGNKSVLLGYFNPGGEMIFFSGDQSDIRVALTPQDKLILFSDH